jgi:hypothetical protein
MISKAEMKRCINEYFARGYSRFYLKDIAYPGEWIQRKAFRQEKHRKMYKERNTYYPNLLKTPYKPL